MPLSTMLPSLITSIRSALRMVLRRWAMTKDVRPTVSESMASWIFFSVLVSTELVASSRISRGASRTMARAMVSCCRWPAEMLSLSPSTVP